MKNAFYSNLCKRTGGDEAHFAVANAVSFPRQKSFNVQAELKV